jgi:cytochrome c peroxidase
MVMIWRQPFAKMIVLAMAGSVWCFGLGLVAWEPVDPWRSAKSLEDQRPRDIRLPSPQRGRGVGGEGDGQAVIGWLPFVVQQTSSAFAAELPQFATPPHPQPLSPSREARRAEVSMQLLSLLANGETKLPELSPPLGLPSVPFPRDNLPTRERIDLGKRLFFDRSLSSDQSTSCATCHNPEHAFADNEVNSCGIDRKKGNRNTPSVINAAFQPYQFWDGRASSLEDQALLPLENPHEMGSSVSSIVDKLNQLPPYRDAFHRAFGSPVTRQNLAQALASFERTVLAGDSAYDRYVAGNQTALSQKAVEGMKLFQGKAHCHLCHQGYNFSDGLFHNLGVGWSESGFADEGRSAVTGIVKDRGSFKTPTLRQVAQTAPYMHDGSMVSLEVVVDFYDRGGQSNPHLDPLIQPLRLTPQEKEALVEFMRSLSGKVNF